MMSQKCVIKKVIWAFFVLAMCTFLTFFMSSFLENAFCDLGVLAKILIPVVLFIILGIVSFCLQSFGVPLIKDLKVHKAIYVIVPCIIFMAALGVSQYYFEIKAGIYESCPALDTFFNTGRAFNVYDFGIVGLYDGGLNFFGKLLGRTIFTISIYNRVILFLSAGLLYLSVRNFIKNNIASNMFAVLFLFGEPVLKRCLYIDITALYVFFCSIFLFALSVAFDYRRKNENMIKQCISLVFVILLLALLIFFEQSSIIFLVPALGVFFSGYPQESKKMYWIVSSVATVLTLAVVFVFILINVIQPLEFIFEIYDLLSMSTYATTVLVLSILGFIGAYGLWHQKLYYVFPLVLVAFYMFFGTYSENNLDNYFNLFVCFCFYAALGVSTLPQFPHIDMEEETEASLEMSVEDVKEEEEIQSIKEINEKLNQVDLEFVPLTFKQPKKKEKKTQGYAYEPSEDEMKYDIEVSEDDDFDI